MQELVSQFSADIAFIPKDGQIGMFSQQFCANFQVSGTSGSQLKIQNQPSQTDQQMQFEAEDGDFLAGDFTKVSPMSRPIACRAGHQMKLDHWHAHRVNRALSIGTQVEPLQHGLPNNIERIHQRSTATIKATLRGLVWEQISMFSPITQQCCFLTPASTLPHQRHRQQLTVAAFVGWARSFEQWVNLLPYIVYHYIHPQAKIVKTVYHCSVSRIGKVKFGYLSLPLSRDTVIDLAYDPNSKIVQVFEIIEVEAQPANAWKVHGLAYLTISVGDMLFVNNPHKDDEYIGFEVKNITIYQRNVSLLGHGYTGELLLKGETDNVLNHTSHLSRFE